MDLKYFFVGMPGSGKSTIGKEISKSIGLKYIDLDELIEESEGKTIPEIFAQDGESYFRQRETELLKVLISNPGQMLVSTGGGAPCFNNNIQLINSGGTSVFIDVSIDELFKRLKLGKQNRPLVQGLSDQQLYNKLSTMLTERLPYYSQSKIKIKGDDLSPDDVLRALEVKS